MASENPENSRHMQSIVPVGQLQSASRQVPNDLASNNPASNNQRMTGASLVVDGTSAAMTGNQINSSTNHQAIPGYYGHAPNQGNQATASIQGHFSLSNTIGGRPSVLYGINQGMGDLQHQAGAESHLNTGTGGYRHNTTFIGLQPSAEIYGGSNIRYNTSVPLGPPMPQVDGFWQSHLIQCTNAIQTNRGNPNVNDLARARPQPLTNPASHAGAMRMGFGDSGIVPYAELGWGNTCLWISGLPPGCTLRDLFVGLAGYGKIFSANILPAEPHDSEAVANVTFWDFEGVQALLASMHQGMFVVGGMRPRVTWDLCFRKSQEQSHKTRVVVIKGPKLVVNVTYFRLHVFRFHHELDIIINRAESQLSCVLECRFASVQQAEEAIVAIRYHKSLLDMGPELRECWLMVKFRYGEDPCTKLRGHSEGKGWESSDELEGQEDIAEI
ncbi:hypothetical protein ONZ43_g298 [Nemania bipapillata]|uniref:Uncharacterized protein n=1 Tax=Nemania bipapillata TaxID=110536 RepID=A0ACC2J8M0_9PEZI|nr:hypothetical protein ONZ43_g298 [Nemania bipapillata]